MIAAWRDAEFALQTLVELVNTDPEVLGVEGLSDVVALGALIRGRKITEVADPSDHELDLTRRLRSNLRAVVAAPVPARIDLVNGLLQRTEIAPELVDHDELGLHLHYFRRYAPLSDHLRADLAMALATLLVSGETERLRVCARPGCNRVLLDTTRSRTRIYCSTAVCGNRVHAAAHRARQKSRV